MENKILYTSALGIGKFNGEALEEKRDSEYIKKYRDTLIQISKKNAWKYSGSSAKFRERYQDKETEEFYAAVNAVCSRGAVQFAVTVTSRAGMMKVATGLLAFVIVIPLEEVQPAKL